MSDMKKWAQRLMDLGHEHGFSCDCLECESSRIALTAAKWARKESTVAMQILAGKGPDDES